MIRDKTDANNIYYKFSLSVTLLEIFQNLEQSCYANTILDFSFDAQLYREQNNLNPL